MSRLITGVLHEIDSELIKTKQVLKNLDETHRDWKPHEKSMTLGQLASHTVELQTAFGTGLKGEAFDFQTQYKPFEYTTFKDLSTRLSKEISDWKIEINESTEEFWLENFILKNGEQVLVKLPRIAFFRSIIMNHLIHHRGQLTVYMRLLDIAVPGVYGPSADDK